MNSVLQEKFFFKKFLPVNKRNKKIEIGVKEAYFEINYSLKNLNLLKKIIAEGVTIDEIEKIPLLKKLLEKKCLEKGSLENSRHKLFFKLYGHKY